MKFPEYPIYLDYPPVPSKPPILKKRLEDLSGKELQEAIEVKTKYDEEMVEYQVKRAETKTYNRSLESKYSDECWKVIYEELGLDEKDFEHPLVKWAISMAWEEGHSSGFSSVGSYMESFIEPYTIHRKILNDLRSKHPEIKI